MSGRQVTEREGESQIDRFQAPWRSVGIGVGAIGTPAITTFLQPSLGAILFAVPSVTLVIIFGAALFGTPTVSDRAFRLLRWLAGRPEPTASPSTTNATLVTPLAADSDDRTSSPQ
jgi:hypothetical protein